MPQDMNGTKSAALQGLTLYLDCQSGVAGDMMVAALLDAGADEAAMRRALASLPVNGFEIRISRVKKAGIDCCVINGKNPELLYDLLEGREIGTRFVAKKKG